MAKFFETGRVYSISLSVDRISFEKYGVKRRGEQCSRIESRETIWIRDCIYTPKTIIIRDTKDICYIFERCDYRNSYKLIKFSFTEECIEEISGNRYSKIIKVTNDIFA